MINTIGVGFDGSPTSAAANRAASDLARRLGARLVAMTAGVSPAPHLGSLTLPSGDEIELVKLEGRAADALARAAADVDLLVLGSRFAHECPRPSSSRPRPPTADRRAGLPSHLPRK